MPLHRTDEVVRHSGRFPRKRGKCDGEIRSESGWRDVDPSQRIPQEGLGM